MGITNFDVVQAGAFVGPSTPLINPFGKVWFVNGSAPSPSDGKTPDSAYTTLTAALTASAAGDTFIIAPGTYSHTATFTPKARQTFIAAVQQKGYPTVTITATSALTGDLITLDVAGVSFIGIEFLAGHANQATLVDIADAADVNGAFFKDCVFNGADKTSVVGIQADDATFIPTGIVIEDCLFRDLTGTGLDIGVLGMPYGKVRHNTFALDINSGTGIALADTTAFATGKGFVIEENNFIGFDATADEVGITIAGTENTTAAGIIRNNYFSFVAAAAITADKISQAMVNNYVGDAGTGGTLVDAGTA